MRFFSADYEFIPSGSMEEHKNRITCSLVRTTRGISPSILAMFTLAPFCIKSFTIYSISRPLAVCNAVLPANVFLFTSAPRDIKNSAMICFPASTAWWSGVRPLLESWKHREWREKKGLDVMNSFSVWLFLCFCLFVVYFVLIERLLLRGMKGLVS